MTRQKIPVQRINFQNIRFDGVKDQKIIFKSGDAKHAARDIRFEHLVINSQTQTEVSPRFAIGPHVEAVSINSAVPGSKSSVPETTPKQ
jgi:hypothetical protein